MFSRDPTCLVYLKLGGPVLVLRGTGLSFLSLPNSSEEVHLKNQQRACNMNPLLPQILVTRGSTCAHTAFHTCPKHARIYSLLSMSKDPHWTALRGCGDCPALILGVGQLPGGWGLCCLQVLSAAGMYFQPYLPRVQEVWQDLLWEPRGSPVSSSCPSPICSAGWCQFPGASCPPG